MGKINPQSAPNGRYRFDGSDERIQFHVHILDHEPHRVIVEYRGTDADLIAAGIVTEDFFSSCRGRRRTDTAGRWVNLRRIRGVTRLRFHGDPLAEPQLPGAIREEIEEAREDFKIRLREFAEAHESQTPMDDADSVVEETAAEWKKRRKGSIFRAMVYVEGAMDWLHQKERFQFADSDTKRMRSIVGRFIGEMQTAIEQAKVVDTETSMRPSYLRLVVVDNERSI